MEKYWKNKKSAIKITEKAMAEETAEKTPEERAVQITAEMTLEDKISQMFFVTPEALAKSREKKAGGVILFADNISSEEQVKMLIGEINDGFEILPFMGVDEEGGTVSRLGEKGIITRHSHMRSIGDSGDSANAARVGETLAEEMLPLGFNVDFAPVTDTVLNPDNKEIGKRSFGADAKLVGEMAAAQIKAMENGGLSACAKHFPNHAVTSVNSHNFVSVSSITDEELKNGGLSAFEAAVKAEVDFMMISHMSLPNINNSDIPCSLSKKIVTGLLKNELGYKGIAITDALNMGAVTKVYSSGESSVLAVKAGIDMLLMPVDFNEAKSSIIKAVNSGEISEERIDESVVKILTLKINKGMIQ